MARQSINVLIASALALGCGVMVGATLAWSSAASPVVGQAYATAADFDQVFADAALPESAMPIHEELYDAGRKRLNSIRLLQSFWVAAIASPYLGAKDAQLLQPLNHLPTLRTGFSATQNMPKYL
jgi:hypothetical protein